MPCISMQPSPVAITIGRSGRASLAPMAIGIAPPIGPRLVSDRWAPGTRTSQYSANQARCAPESTQRTASSGSAARSPSTARAGCIGTASLAQSPSP
jgi:hypothetical protein